VSSQQLTSTAEATQPYGLLSVLGGPTGLGTQGLRLGGRADPGPSPPSKTRGSKPILSPDGSITFTVHDLATDSEFVVSMHCPLLSGRHPRSDALLEGHRRWAQSFDLFADEDDYARFCATRFDFLVSAQCHRLSLDAALVVSHLMTWFFVYDDAQEREHARQPGGSKTTRRAVQRHLDVLDGDDPRDDDSPTLIAFADFLRRARELGGGGDDPWYRRMVHNLRLYAHGTLGEGILDPASGANTALHWQVRQMTVAVQPGCDLAACAQSIRPACVAHDFFVARMEQLTTNYNLWVNDLLGLNRDQRYGLRNTVLIMRNEFGLPLEQVTRMAAHHSDQELRAFMNFERELPRLLGDAWHPEAASLAAYAEVLKNCMRGLVDWTAASDRYQADEDLSLAGA